MARLTKQTLIEDLALHNALGETSKKDITDIVNTVFAYITDNVIVGNEVAIAGFGKFTKFAKTKDGKPTGMFDPKFKAFADFKAAVNA